jgi:hypothetical protein
MTTWWLVEIDDHGQPVDVPADDNRVFIVFKSISADNGDEDSLVTTPRKPSPTIRDSAIALPEPVDEEPHGNEGYLGSAHQ